MRSIYFKEIAAYFNSLIGYLAIGIFLLISSLLLWVFPDSSILEAGYASLDQYFLLAPYLFMFLIPAITMRSIAGEKADGTYDLLLSSPRPLSSIVIGKFLGSLTLVALAIVPTLVYAVSIYLLSFPTGNIDLAGILSSYIGLMLLGMGFTAIGLFTSSLTKNPIVAFLLGVLACFIAYYSLEALSQLPALESYEDTIKALGMLDHYYSMSRGVFFAKDILYFSCLSLIFITFTIGHLGRSFTPRKVTFTRYAAVILLFFVCNNSAVSGSLGRVDFTEDQRFTLNPTSIALAESLDRDVYITLFLDGDLPAGFQRLKQAAIALVNDLKSYNPQHIKFNIINPHAGSQAEQQELQQALIHRGIQPTNLNVKNAQGFSQKIIFPTAIVSTDEQEITVNLLQQKTGAAAADVLHNSIENLGYAFTAAMTKVVQKETPFIGFLEGHGEPSDIALYDAMQSLMLGNQVGRVNLDSVTYDSLKQLKLLFVVKPTQPFSESDKYKIDYFVRHGGRVVWALDQIDASLDHLRQNGQQPLLGHQLNLDDQLFLYGARFNYNLVADLNCGQIPLSVGNIGGQPQIELVPWYFFPILMPVGQHPILRNLDGIRSEFIGTIDTISSPTIHKELLLSSSPFTRLLQSPAPISLDMVEQTPDPETFRTKPEAVAFLYKGVFPYLYENRNPPLGIDSAVDLSQVTQESKMLFIADGDWLINQVEGKDQSPYPLGWDKFTQQQYANKVFLENVVDYLLNDEQLISLRNKEVKLRLLDQAKIKNTSFTWQLINVLAPLLLLTAIALAQQAYRRYTYHKK